jgi:HD-like signal output (HDOD) protein/CheY-like chemotaxis protein
LRRVLFVDDQPQILDGLRDLLRPLRHELDVSTAPSAEAALTALEAAEFDVVVSDMRMPGMQGTALLERVRDRWPHVVRIILSGHAEAEAALRAVTVAHQFLAKPCERDELVEVIRRACEVRSVLDDPLIHRIVTETDSLPSLPSLWHSLVNALANPEVSIREVANIIEQDMAMCAKVLQLANSAFFGLGRPIATISDAVAYLGLSTTKDLVLTTEAFHAFDGAALPRGFSLEELQRHALTVGRLVSQIAAEDDAFVAGVLHDVGKLVRALHAPVEYGETLAKAREAGVPVHAVEQAKDRITHAEVGGYLLRLWGLPNPIVEAVANHHAPARAGSSTVDLVTAVHVANVLVHEQSTNGSSACAGIDDAYVERLGVTDMVPVWRTLAAAQADVFEEAV